jgi:hypothetical protein
MDKVQKPSNHEVNICYTSPNQNVLVQGEVLLPLPFSFLLLYTIRKVQENQVELKLNETHQLLQYANDILVNLLEDTINTIKKNAQSITDGIKVWSRNKEKKLSIC